MKNRILLIGGNYFPEPTGIGKYNGEMIDWLSSQNFHCGVITTYPYYPHWKIQHPYTGKSFWYKHEQKRQLTKLPVTIYRCPHYVPVKPTGSKRILSDLSFFLSAFFQVFRLLFHKKYDYILVVAPPFQLGLLGLLYKKIKKAKLIYHIQDLQIDAAINLGMIKSKLLIRSIFFTERYILKKADIVSSISEGMVRKVKAKLERDILLFPNWVDTHSFYPIADKESLLVNFNFSPKDKIILYSGAIGEKQGLQAVLETARALSDIKHIKFIICGTGPYKERLVRLADDMNLGNVYFMPLQPIQRFNELLNLAHIHLVLQKRNDNELFMPSKLTTILSVGGLVIVTAMENTSLHEIISKNNIGLVIEPENDVLLTETIEKAIGQNHQEIKQNALKYANVHLKISNVLSAYFGKCAEY